MLPNPLRPFQKQKRLIRSNIHILSWILLENNFKNIFSRVRWKREMRTYYIIHCFFLNYLFIYFFTDNFILERISLVASRICHKFCVCVGRLVIKEKFWNERQRRFSRNIWELILTLIDWPLSPFTEGETSSQHRIIRRWRKFAMEN